MDMRYWLEEFETDWVLQGKSVTTARNYRLALLTLTQDDPGTVTLSMVKRWLAGASSVETARFRGRAVRAFARWLGEQADAPSWGWVVSVPLATTPPRPQPTVTEDDHRQVLARAATVRDRCVIELLWATGMRVTELARLQVSDVDLQGGFCVVAQSKTGRPRVTPLSVTAARSCRRLVGGRQDGPLLGMSAHAIQLLLRRLHAPSAHAWRRGWAVQALRHGVSETSVRAAAGWSSGAMVVRYTSAVSGELAVAEFKRVRSI